MRPVRTTLSACLFASLLAGAPVSAQPGPTPPTIATFVHADYPDVARAAGQEAAVELEITIGADGLIRDARVIAPVSEGFDEAMLAAVRQFVFEPATNSGHPIAARIHYRYVFTLTSAAPVYTDWQAIATAPAAADIASRFARWPSARWQRSAPRNEARVATLTRRSVRHDRRTWQRSQGNCRSDEFVDPDTPSSRKAKRITISGT